MLLAAGRALGAQTPALGGVDAPLLPAIGDLRRIAVEVAVAVGEEAQRQGLAPASTGDRLRRNVVDRQWEPTYDAPSSPDVTSPGRDLAAGGVEALLDEGLTETFPASDPVAVSAPR
jgi:hypothetical protein